MTSLVAASVCLNMIIERRLKKRWLFINKLCIKKGFGCSNNSRVICKNNYYCSKSHICKIWFQRECHNIKRQNVIENSNI